MRGPASACSYATSSRSRICSRRPIPRSAASRSVAACGSVSKPEPATLNVLQVCDHLGWEGSRMHGVKRLFSWMIPRFDRQRFNVSLVSLRRRDLSEETLDSLGIDITYLERSKFDPLTLPAMLRIVDRKMSDILHLHGYGATT